MQLTIKSGDLPDGISQVPEHIITLQELTSDQYIEIKGRKEYEQLLVDLKKYKDFFKVGFVTKWYEAEGLGRIARRAAKHDIEAIKMAIVKYIKARFGNATTSDITRAFQHYRGVGFKQILQELETAGVIVRHHHNSTGGRPKTTYDIL